MLSAILASMFDVAKCIYTERKMESRQANPTRIKTVMLYLLMRNCLYYIIPLLMLAHLANAGDVEPRTEVYLPDYKNYHNVSSISKFVSALAAKYPGYFSLDLSFKSRSDVPQHILRMTNFSSPRTSFESKAHGVSNIKPRLLLSFGEHAREFFPVESLIHLLKRIVWGLSATPNSPDDIFTRRTLSGLDVFIVVMANPDGRHYIERTSNYCWRGTGVGVDLDRNFKWNFGGPGSSGDPKDEEYRGPYPHSEPEGEVYRELSDAYKFDAFVSFHSGIQQIYIPFADSTSRKSKRVIVNSAVQLGLAEAMAKAGGPQFRYGIGYNLCEYPADGTIYDFMAGVKKIPFSLNVELWGGGDTSEQQCFDLFNPPSDELQASVQSIMPLYEALFSHISEWKRKQVHEQYHLEQTDFHIPKSYIIPFLLCLCVFIAIFCHQVPCAFNSRFYSRKRIVSLRSLSSTFTTVNNIKLT